MSRGTQEPLEAGLHFHIRGCHPLWPAFPDRSINAFLTSFNQEGITGTCFRRRLLIIVVLQHQAFLANRLVWAIPSSLAATIGITVVFSSSGY